MAGAEQDRALSVPMLGYTFTATKLDASYSPTKRASGHTLAQSMIHTPFPQPRSKTERGAGVFCEVESDKGVGGLGSGGLLDRVGVPNGGSKVIFCVLSMLDCTIPAATVVGVSAVDVDMDVVGRADAKSCQVTLLHSEVRNKWSAVSL